MDTNPYNKLTIYQIADRALQLNVKLETETMWLNRNQIALLFDRDVKAIGKHINNALKEELFPDETNATKFTTNLTDSKNPTVAKFATFQIEAAKEVVRNMGYYNIDVILSVSYRVKSKRGIEFHRWANKGLRDYIIKGAIA